MGGSADDGIDATMVVMRGQVIKFEGEDESEEEFLTPSSSPESKEDSLGLGVGMVGPLPESSLLIVKGDKNHESVKPQLVNPISSSITSAPGHGTHNGLLPRTQPAVSAAPSKSTSSGIQWGTWTGSWGYGRNPSDHHNFRYTIYKNDTRSKPTTARSDYDLGNQTFNSTDWISLPPELPSNIDPSDFPQKQLDTKMKLPVEVTLCGYFEIPSTKANEKRRGRPKHRLSNDVAEKPEHLSFSKPIQHKQQIPEMFSIRFRLQAPAQGEKHLSFGEQSLLAEKDPGYSPPPTPSAGHFVVLAEGTGKNSFGKFNVSGKIDSSSTLVLHKSYVLDIDTGDGSRTRNRRESLSSSTAVGRRRSFTTASVAPGNTEKDESGQPAKRRRKSSLSSSLTASKPVNKALPTANTSAKDPTQKSVQDKGQSASPGSKSKSAEIVAASASPKFGALAASGASGDLKIKRPRGRPPKSARSPVVDEAGNIISLDAPAGSLYGDKSLGKKGDKGIGPHATSGGNSFGSPGGSSTPTSSGTVCEKCHICLNTKSDGGHILLKCGLCQLIVHRRCYGILPSQVPTRDVKKGTEPTLVPGSADAKKSAKIANRGPVNQEICSASSNPASCSSSASSPRSISCRDIAACADIKNKKLDSQPGFLATMVKVKEETDGCGMKNDEVDIAFAKEATLSVKKESVKQGSKGVGVSSSSTPPVVGPAAKEAISKAASKSSPIVVPNKKPPTSIPASSWRCRRCENTTTPRGLQCIFCPVREGAFKRTTDGRWAHVACAYWIPEAGFLNSELMEPIGAVDPDGNCMGIEKIPSYRFFPTKSPTSKPVVQQRSFVHSIPNVVVTPTQLPLNPAVSSSGFSSTPPVEAPASSICSVCQRGGGAWLRCSYIGCQLVFHPLCGRGAGVYMRVCSPRLLVGTKTLSGIPMGRSLVIITLCKEHKSSEWELVKSSSSNNNAANKQSQGQATENKPPESKDATKDAVVPASGQATAAKVEIKGESSSEPQQPSSVSASPVPPLPTPRLPGVSTTPSIAIASQETKETISKPGNASEIDLASPAAAPAGFPSFSTSVTPRAPPEAASSATTMSSALSVSTQVETKRQSPAPTPPSQSSLSTTSMSPKLRVSMKAVDGYGEKYTGEVLQNALRHGNGICVYKNHWKYEGEWRMGRESGTGSLYDEEKRLIYTGSIVDGKISGYGTCYYSNGDEYAGEWRDNVRYGYGTYRWKDSNSSYEGQWVNNRRHGRGCLSLSSGRRYDGDWKMDAITGNGRYTVFAPEEDLLTPDPSQSSLPSASVPSSVPAPTENDRILLSYDGQWKNGIMEGRGTCVYDDNSRFEGIWKGGLKDGRGTLIFANGSCYEGRFREDKLGGTGTLTMNNIVYDDGSEEGDRITQSDIIGKKPNLVLGSEYSRGVTETKLDSMSTALVPESNRKRPWSTIIPLDFQPNVHHIHLKAGFSEEGW